MNFMSCLICEKTQGLNRLATHEMTVYFYAESYKVFLCQSCERDVFLKGQSAFDGIFSQTLGLGNEKYGGTGLSGLFRVRKK